MKTNPFEEIVREQYLCALELLKDYDHGTPEFDFAFVILHCYKTYMDATKREKYDHPT